MSVIGGPLGGCAPLTRQVTESLRLTADARSANREHWRAAIRD